MMNGSDRRSSQLFTNNSSAGWGSNHVTGSIPISSANMNNYKNGNNNNNTNSTTSNSNLSSFGIWNNDMSVWS